jgi:hypothetical protein
VLQVAFHLDELERLWKPEIWEILDLASGRVDGVALDLIFPFHVQVIKEHGPACLQP